MSVADDVDRYITSVGGINPTTGRAFTPEEISNLYRLFGSLDGGATTDYGGPEQLDVGLGIDWYSDVGIPAWQIAAEYGLGRQQLGQDWLGTLLQDELSRMGLGTQTYGMLQAGEQARMGLGQSLMNELVRQQQDPFNIVTALQAYGATPSATPMAADIAATGGLGRPSPYGNLVEQLTQSLASFAQRGMPAAEDVWGYAPATPEWLGPYMPTGEGGAGAGAGAAAAGGGAGAAGAGAPGGAGDGSLFTSYGRPSGIGARYEPGTRNRGGSFLENRDAVLRYLASQGVDVSDPDLGYSVGSKGTLKTYSKSALKEAVAEGKRGMRGAGYRAPA